MAYGPFTIHILCNALVVGERAAIMLYCVIANRFRYVFAGASFDSYADAHEIAVLHNRFLPPSELPENNIFSIEDIERSLNSIKSWKAPGIDKISKEHIMFSHPAVFVHVFAYLIV